MKEVILFDNYDSYEWKDDAIESLKENGCEVTDEAIWNEIGDMERMYWDDMLDQLEGKLESTVLISGTCGTWQGTGDAGHIFSAWDMPRWADGDMLKWILAEAGKDCDYFKIGYNESGNLFVQCTHHDGTNYYEIKNLTEKGRNAWSDWEYSVRFNNLSEQEMHEKLYNSNNYYTEKVKLPEWY